MPQRFLRPGIRNSERWNSVPFEAQSFYTRIITLVDDYGRYDGRPAVLHGECFAMWNKLNPTTCINLQQVERMLQQLAASFLLELYEAEGKQVLQLTQWKDNPRAGTRSKWPSKPEVAATCCNLPPPSPSPSPADAPSVDSRTDFPEPHIPSLQEVAAFGAEWPGDMHRGIPAGIPKDFCEHYHGVCTDKRRWVLASGHLISWQTELPRWWAKDWQGWKSERGESVTSRKPSLQDQLSEWRPS